jgi:hypothetical protein
MPAPERLHDGLLTAGARRTLALADRTLPSGHYVVQVRDRWGVGSERVAVLR